MAESILRSNRRWLRAVLPIGLGALLMLGVMLALMPLAGQHDVAASPEATGLLLNVRGPDSTIAGSVVTYTILITNQGTQLDSATIIDHWTSNQVYSGTYAAVGFNITGTDFITLPNYTVAFHVAGPIAPNQAGQIIVTTTIPPELQPNYDLLPTIVANQVLGGSVNPPGVVQTDTANVTIVGPVFLLTKVFTPTSPRIGQLLTYTFSLLNYGRFDTIDGTNVVITEHLPDNTDFYSAQPPDIAAYSPASNIVTWTLPSPVTKGSTANVTLTVHVTESWPYQQVGWWLGNPPDHCGARAAELPYPVMCKYYVSTPIGPVVDKTVVTELGSVNPNDPAAPWQTYPNRVVTYTTYFYNPRNTTISGVILTDTLPNQYDSPPPTPFVYLNTLTPGVSVIGQSITQVVWSLPTIQAWATYSFTWRALVPAQIYLGGYGNPSIRDYPNSLSASAPDSMVWVNGNAGVVRVVAQVRLYKSVSPSTAFSGDPVTYSIIMWNAGNTPISNIRVTETLYSTFVYSDVVNGTPPPISYTATTAIWDNLSLQAGAIYTLTFRAIASAYDVPKNYCNIQVDGSTPDTTIVSIPAGQACVYIDTPLRYNKSVTPDHVVIGNNVTYNASEWNIGESSMSADGFKDYLPSGFVAIGGSTPGTEVYTASPFTLTLLPNKGNTYQLSFGAQVVNTPNCNYLWFSPQVFNSAGAIQFHIYSPPSEVGWWGNMDPAAPTVVVPQIWMIQSVDPPAVSPGGTVTFTLVLSNNTSIAQTGIQVTDTLPLSFTYLSAVSGPPPADVAHPPLVVWSDLTVPANGSLTLKFKAVAPTVLSDYYQNRTDASGADPNLCIPASGPTLPQPGAIVMVRNPIVVYYKQIPFGPTVARYQTMDYIAVIQNYGPYTMSNVVITDLLPTGVSFVSMVQGPAPITVSPLPVWNLTLPFGNNPVTLRFTVRVGGDAVLSPPPSENYMTGTVPYPGGVFTPTDWYDGAPVNIIPGIGLYKEVSTNVATAGSTVIYTVTLGNGTILPLTGIRLTDTLPTGFTYEAILSGTAPVITSPVVVWTPADIPVGQQAIMVFRARISNTLPSGIYYNRVDGTSSAFIPSTDNTAPVQVMGLPNVLISKQADPSAALAGDTVAYTITLQNQSEVSLTVRITDTLPVSFSYVSTIGSTPPPLLTQPLVWDGINLTPTQVVQLGFLAAIDPRTSANTYYNSVNGSSGQYIFNGTGNTAPIQVSGPPNVVLSKQASPTSVLGGGNVIYTITLQNQSPLSLLVNVTDTLPVSFSFVSAISPTPAPVSTQPLVWQLVPLPPNGSSQLVFQVSTDPNIPLGVYYNSVNASSGKYVFSGSGPTAPVTVTVPTYDLQVTKTDNSLTATIGSTTIYTIIYTNANPFNLTAANVVLTETLDPAAWLSSSSAGWNLVSPGVYTYSNGNLSANSSNQIQFAVAIDPNIPDIYQDITNTVRIGSAGALEKATALEQPTSNNVFTDVDVIRGSDLVVLGMGYTPARLRQRGTIVVTVTLQNQGVISTTGPDGDPNKGWFGSDLYVKPAGALAPTGPADRYLGFCSTSLNPCPTNQQRGSLYQPTQGYFVPGLAPGQTWVLTYTYVLPSGGVQWLYFQADTFWAANGDPDPLYGSSQHGRIVEGNELNNIYGPLPIYVNPNVYLPVIFKQK